MSYLIQNSETYLTLAKRVKNALQIAIPKANLVLQSNNHMPFPRMWWYITNVDEVALYASCKTCEVSSDFNEAIIRIKIDNPELFQFHIGAIFENEPTIPAEIQP